MDTNSIILIPAGVIYIAEKIEIQKNKHDSRLTKDWKG